MRSKISAQRRANRSMMTSYQHVDPDPKDVYYLAKDIMSKAKISGSIGDSYLRKRFGSSEGG